MISFVRRSAGNRGFRALADGGVPMVLGAALACVLAACAPAAAGEMAAGRVPQHGGFSCRGPALRHHIAKAYVTGNAGLTVVSLATGKAVRLKAIHDDASAIVSSDGRTAYAATGDSIVPISVATNAVGKPIPVPAGAFSVAIAPSGRVLYAAGGKGITPVFLRTCTTGRVIPTPGGLDPSGPFAITRDGRTAYLGGSLEKDDGTSTSGFLRVDLARGIAGKFRTLPAFDVAAISPDARTAYISGGPSVTPVSLATGKLGKPIKIPGLGGSAIAITRDGHTAYVGNVKPETPSSGIVIPVNLAAGTAGRPIHVPSYPFSVSGIAISGDGRTAYVANSASVIPVHLAARKAGKPISMADGAWFIALTP